MRVKSAGIIVMFLVLIALNGTAMAVSGYLTQFTTQYPAADRSRIDSCTLCHTSVPALNSFGTAFRTTHTFTPIENTDSDGDGATNIVEINALTFPGNAADRPAPASVSVPNVVGSTEAAARASITGAGLTVGAVTTQNSPTVPPGQVISQNPAAGASVAQGTGVSFVISAGVVPIPTLSVPNVVGSTEAAARASVTGIGLTVGAVTTQSSATVPAGQVISQNPAAGANVAQGSGVSLVISSGPAPGNQPQPQAFSATDLFDAPTNTNWRTVLGKWALDNTAFVSPGQSFASNGKRNNIAIFTGDPAAATFTAGQIQAQVMLTTKTSKASIVFSFNTVKNRKSYRFIRFEGKRFVAGQVGIIGTTKPGIKSKQLVDVPLNTFHPVSIDVLNNGTVLVNAGTIGSFTVDFGSADMGEIGFLAIKKARFDDFNAVQQ